MSTKETKSEAQQIKDLLIHWLQHWYYFVICFAVCAVIGGIYYITATPIYEVSSSVSLRHDESIMGAVAGSSQAKSLMSSFGFGGKGSDNIEDETLKLSSQGHIKEVIKYLGLNTVYKEKKFLGIIKNELFDMSPIKLSADPSIPDTLALPIKFSINLGKDKAKVTVKAAGENIGEYNVQSFPTTLTTPCGEFTLDKSEHYGNCKLPMKLDILYTSYDYMAQLYRETIAVDFEKKTSDIIHLSYQGPNNTLSKNILNEVINVYNRLYLSDRDLVTQKTLEFVDERINETLLALDAADSKIQAFKKRYNLTEIEADVTYNFTLAGEIQAQLLEAETKVKIVDIMTDFLNDPENKYALIPYDFSSDPALATVIEKYNEQLVKRNELNKANSHSSITKSLDEQIEFHRENMVRSLNNTKQGLTIALNTLKKKDTELSSKLGNIPNIEKDYVTLRREQEIQQTVYIFLLEMKEQMGVQGVNILPKLKMVNSPYVKNKRVSPSLMKTGVVILFIGGLLIPITLIYLVPFTQTLLGRKED